MDGGMNLAEDFVPFCKLLPAQLSGWRKQIGWIQKSFGNCGMLIVSILNVTLSEPSVYLVLSTLSSLTPLSTYKRGRTPIGEVI